MITIKVKCNAGDTIEDSFINAIRIAKILDCKIEFKFNDVLCFVLPNSDFEIGIHNYRNALANGYKFAFC